MFDERMALKIRLEQLADSEERILREFRQEREMIFGSLSIVVVQIFPILSLWKECRLTYIPSDKLTPQYLFS